MFFRRRWKLSSGAIPTQSGATKNWKPGIWKQSFIHFPLSRALMSGRTGILFLMICSRTSKISYRKDWTSCRSCSLIIKVKNTPFDWTCMFRLLSRGKRSYKYFNKDFLRYFKYSLSLSIQLKSHSFSFSKLRWFTEYLNMCSFPLLLMAYTVISLASSKVLIIISSSLLFSQTLRSKRSMVNKECISIFPLL